MTFTKETAKVEGAKGLKAKEERKEDLWAYLASGGQRRYNELLEKQYNDEPIGKEQAKAMDRSERLFPYIKARKTDITTDGKELPQPIMNVPSDDFND